MIIVLFPTFLQGVFFVPSVFSPIIISDQVFFDSDEPAAGVNVILRRTADESVVSFAFTDSEGRFSIKCDEKDGLSLLVTGIDVEMTDYPIDSIRQNLRIVIKSVPLNIKEARVKAAPFTMKSDTLNFTVAQYKVESDRTIADVLKKMPGIFLTPKNTSQSASEMQSQVPAQ